jgi:hypothetical protein
MFLAFVKCDVLYAMNATSRPAARDKLQHASYAGAVSTAAGANHTTGPTVAAAQPLKSRVEVDCDTQ